MKTILVPYDFSQEAEYAFDFACQMAKKTKNVVSKDFIACIILKTESEYNKFNKNEAL